MGGDSVFAPPALDVFVSAPPPRSLAGRQRRALARRGVTLQRAGEGSPWRGERAPVETRESVRLFCCGCCAHGAVGVRPGPLR